MSEPDRNHWVPVFYLKQWCPPWSNELIVYERDQYADGQVRTSPRHPKNTAFQRGLYALEHLPDDQRQWVEKELFTKNVDTPAAPVLKELLAGKVAALDEDQRSAWTTFLMVLLTRTPEYVARLRNQGRVDIRAELERNPEEYEAIRELDEEDSFLNWVDKNIPGKAAGLGETVALKGVLPQLVTKHNMRRIILGMDWQVYDVSSARLELLTSDRPLLRVNDIRAGNSLVALPLDPKTLFVAAHITDIFGLADADELVKRANESVVSAAVNWVYGSNDHQVRFVENWLERLT